MKCPNCGKETKKKIKFCEGCGTELETGKLNENVVKPSNKKGNTGLIVAIVVSFLLIVGVIIGIVLLNGGSNSSDDSDDTENSESSGNGGSGGSENNGKNENSGSGNNGSGSGSSGTRYADGVSDKDKKIIKNISEEVTCDTLDDYCIITVYNKNKESVNIYVSEINIYDQDNNFYTSNVYTPLYCNGFVPNGVCHVFVRKNYLRENLESIGKYEIKYGINDITSKPQNDYIELNPTDNKKDKKLEVEIKNNSKEDLNEIQLFAIFYKDGKIVGSNIGVLHYTEKTLKAGKTSTIEIEYPKYNYSIVLSDFDNYEVFLNEAYKSSH